MSAASPGAPSPFFLAHLPALCAAARLGPVLDLACGSGRHTLASAAAGARVVAVDRDALALARLAARASALGCSARVRALRTDLEAGLGLPLRPGVFGAVLVFRYLHRPLAHAIAGALRPGGLLLYETFGSRQRELGHGPRNPAFLLEPGELRTLFPQLEVRAFEEGRFGAAHPEWLARLAACKRRD